MKLMIASDIHGSADYYQLKLEAFQAEKVDKLLLLGDILYHGPRNDLPKGYAPKQVIAMLSGLIPVPYLFQRKIASIAICYSKIIFFFGKGLKAVRNTCPIGSGVKDE